LEAELGRGESEAIILARELTEDFLILDDMMKAGFYVGEAVYRKVIETAGEN